MYCAQSVVKWEYFYFMRRISLTKPEFVGLFLFRLSSALVGFRGQLKAITISHANPAIKTLFRAIIGNVRAVVQLLSCQEERNVWHCLNGCALVCETSVIWHCCSYLQSTNFAVTWKAIFSNTQSKLTLNFIASCSMRASFSAKSSAFQHHVVSDVCIGLSDISREMAWLHAIFSILSRRIRTRHFPE